MFFFHQWKKNINIQDKASYLRFSTSNSKIHINLSLCIISPSPNDLYLKFKLPKMKQIRFLASTFATGMLFFLSSCSSNDDTKTEDTTATATTTTETAPEPATPAKLSNVMIMQF